MGKIDLESIKNGRSNKKIILYENKDFKKIVGNLSFSLNAVKYSVFSLES